MPSPAVTPCVKFIDQNNNAFGVERIGNKLHVSTAPYTYEIAAGLTSETGVPQQAHNFYLTDFWGSEVNNDKAAFRLYVRAPGSVFQIKSQVYCRSGYFKHKLDFPLTIAPKSDIEVRCISLTANAIVSAGFNGWYGPI